MRTAAGTFSLNRPVIVGVVNATPDSFSDEGERNEASFVRKVNEQVEAGAGIIEVGGESNVTNRPAVEAAEEIARGFVLTCQSHPVTDRVVLDYDAR